MAAEKKHCKGCGTDVATVQQVLSDGPHYSKLTCGECGKFICFLPKPKNENKRQKNRYLPADLGVDHCQLCCRHKTRLGGRSVLEVHHVYEIGNGGEDEPSNIWVLCSACHKYVHHQRLYLNIHQQEKYSFAELEADLTLNNISTEVQQQLKRIYQAQEALNAERYR